MFRYFSPIEKIAIVVVVITLVIVIGATVWFVAHEPPQVTWASYEQKIVKTSGKCYRLIPVGAEEKGSEK